MRVAFDAHMVGARETGNETYALELSRALANRPEELELILYGMSRAGALLGHAPVRLVPDIPDALRIAALYPYLTLRDRVDLLHVTYVAPPATSCATVVSVHDVTFKLFPEHFSRRDLLMLNSLVGVSARRAGAVLALSTSGKQDIVEHLKVPEQRVVVAPLAAGSQYRPMDAPEARAAARSLGIGRRFVLAVGNLQPRKNIGRLLTAFREIAPRVPDVDLVLVGQRAWRGSELEGHVRSLGLESRVLWLGYVDPTKLPALYGAADCLCYPSLYEGFGLPVLEAMACGTPVVTGNRSSLPEVVGDAGLMIDPTSTSDLAHALLRVLTDAGLRDHLSKLGILQAGRFSWDRTAGLTIEAYRLAIGDQHSRGRGMA